MNGDSAFAVHADDTFYMWDGLDEVSSIKASLFGVPPQEISAEDSALAKATARYWYTFAKTGDPNPVDEEDTAVVVTKELATTVTLTTWPKFTTDSDTILKIAVESEGGLQLEQGLRAAACDWQEQNDIEEGILQYGVGATGPFADVQPLGVSSASGGFAPTAVIKFVCMGLLSVWFVELIEWISCQ